jgi:thiol-disulfide isomerase/thioredoxin
MKSKKSLGIFVLVGIVVGAAFVLRSQLSEESTAIEPEGSRLASEAPTFIELGSDRCTSCRAMIPVLDELKSNHACALNVRFIDVWDAPEKGDEFGVTTIPSQVLLGPDGKELTRHTGFWSADAIRTAFASNGHALRSCAP